MTQAPLFYLIHCPEDCSQGKASSKYNALRHGLAVSILHDPAVCSEIETLACAIADRGADNVRLSKARSIAEARLDLVRIQNAKVTLMNSQIAGTMRPKPVTYGDHPC